MISFIIVAALILAHAINPGAAFAESGDWFVAGMLLLGVVMDVVGLKSN
jgi:hypothetical protein